MTRFFILGVVSALIISRLRIPAQSGDTQFIGGHPDNSQQNFQQQNAGVQLGNANQIAAATSVGKNAPGYGSYYRYKQNQGAI